MLGTRFIGRYKVIEELGRGGMGIVYRGEDPRLERPVAIKVLPPRKTSSAKALERFKREARVCARLDHPYIMKIYDYGEEENTYHIVMEYVEGITLREFIGEDPDPDAIDVPEMCRLMGQMCQALEYAHSLKITHRDIKPENIMITTETGSWPKGIRKVKVMDFGLAVLEDRHDLTDMDAIMGTIAYFSPEQARGERADHRSDIYSLGIVFYEMLTGQLPFEATNPSDMIRRHLETPPPSPRLICPTVSPILERIVLTCMRKDPADRYQSVHLIREELELYRAGHNISAAHFWGATGIVVGGSVEPMDERPEPTPGDRSMTQVSYDERPAPPPFPGENVAPEKIQAPPQAAPQATSQASPQPPGSAHPKRDPDHSPAELAPPDRPLENVQLGTLDDESTNDELRLPPLASPFTPGMPPSIANRLGPPKPIPVKPGNEPKPFSPPPPSAIEPKKPRVIPTVGTSPVASAGWMEAAQEEATENKSQWGKYQQVLSKLKRNDLGEPQEVDIPPTVCGRCGIENPGDRKYCLDCGSLLASSTFQLQREAAAHNELGLRLMAQGNFTDALNEFQQALLRSPDLAEAHYNLGRLYVQLGDTIKAEEEFKLAATMLRDSFDVHRELGELYRSQDRKDEAIGAFEEALKIKPDSATVRCQLAFLYSHRGELSRAVAEYRQVLTYARDSLDAHLQLGIIYGSQGLVPESIVEFEAVTRLDPYNQTAWQWLGRLYTKRQRFNDAEKAYQSALQINPADPTVHAELGAVYEVQRKEELALRELRQAVSLDQGNVEARSRLAGLYAKHRQPKMAIQELEEVASYNPSDARVHQQLGDLYLATNQLDKALQHFERTVSLDPSSAEMHNKLGQVYLKKDYDKQSIQHYQQAVSIEPTNPDYHEDLGMAYYVNGQRDAAITEIKKASILNSRNADYFKALGILMEEEGRLDEAKQYLAKAIELNPRDADAHGLLGRVHGRQGLINYAILEFQKALEYKPNNQLMMVYLARAYAEQGRPELAVQHFQKAISLMGAQIQTPENRAALARSYQELGKAYLEAGDARRAQDVLESAVALTPDDPRGLRYAARVYSQQGNAKKALEALTAALVRVPNDPDVLADIAAVYDERGEYELAMRAIRKAITVSPNRPSYYETLATLLAGRKQYQEAADTLRRAMALDGKRADHYHYVQANFLMDQGMFQKAAGEYQQGLAINSWNWRLYAGLARAFEEMRRYDEAAVEIKKALGMQLPEAEAKKLKEDLERLRTLSTR
jgi:tetratricopeptide (TPR) repeat protein/serine/threonine protein kinase